MQTEEQETWKPGNKSMLYYGSLTLLDIIVTTTYLLATTPGPMVQLRPFAHAYIGNTLCGVLVCHFCIQATTVTFNYTVFCIEKLDA